MATLLLGHIGMIFFISLLIKYQIYLTKEIIVYKIKYLKNQTRHEMIVIDLSNIPSVIILDENHFQIDYTDSPFMSILMITRNSGDCF